MLLNYVPTHLRCPPSTASFPEARACQTARRKLSGVRRGTPPPGPLSWGIDPDRHCLRSGVTTVVDAGSASWTMLSGFRWYIAEKAAARVLCFLHISGIGLVNAWVGEMRDMSHADVEAVGLLAAENRDLVVGIKVRQGIDQVGAHGTDPVRLARRASELAGLPMMVHIGAGVPLPSVLEVMRSGDTATHCFQGRGDTILD